MSTIQRLFAVILAMLLLSCTFISLAEEPYPTINPYPDPTRPPDVAEYDTERPEDLMPEQLWAWSAVLIEADSGKVIFEKNIHERRFPASTTKIMTLLLALMLVDDLDRDVVCSERAVSVNNTDDNISSLKLQAGEVISFRDLLYGTMLASANDGANVIAEAVSGSIENFVALMNEFAAQIGCQNTHFANPHGLHDESHYTTAYDMALITRVAMENETFRDIVATKSYTMSATSVRRSRTVNNTNELFNPGTSEKPNRYYYPDAIGVKTGYTTPAHRCFVGAAERDGVTLISVVMYAGDNSRWADTIKLFDYGFSQYTSVSPIDLYNMNPITIETSSYSLNDQAMGKLALSCAAVDAVAASKVRIIATKDEIEAMAANLKETCLIQYTRDFAAPVKVGEVMGTMTFFPEEGEPVVYHLLASRTIAKRENAPKTLDEIIAETDADPNPLPRTITIEMILLAAAPLTMATIIVLFFRRLLFGRRKKRRREKTPPVTHRFLR